MFSGCAKNQDQGAYKNWDFVHRMSKDQAGPGGVLVIGKNGTHLGTIKTVERTANCTFDSNYEYLYMTTDMYLTRVKLKTY